MTLVVFDIDGTLADIEHRRGYVRTKPKNWKAFEAGIPNDEVNLPVAKVFRQLVSDGAFTDVVLASGRSEKSRQATEDWFRFYNLLGYRKLYMRPDGDYRSDVEVKSEILDQIIVDFGKKPDMVFDDRPGVVNMWRDRGIFVFDCNQSGEDF